MWIYNGGWNETPGSPTTAAIWRRSFEWRRRDCDFAGMRRPFGYSSKDRHRPYYATASSAERQVRNGESGSTLPVFRLPQIPSVNRSLAEIRIVQPAIGIARDGATY